MKTITLENGKKVEISEESYTALAESISKPCKNWRAKPGDKYFYTSDCGQAVLTRERSLHEDDYRYVTGNYFRTEEEALAHKERQLAIGRVTRAINDANGDWEPDWEDVAEPKFCIYLFLAAPQVVCHSATSGHRGLLVLPVIQSTCSAFQIIDNYKDDLRLILGDE